MNYNNKTDGTTFTVCPVQGRQLKDVRNGPGILEDNFIINLKNYNALENIPAW